eukprot:UN19553
MRSSRMVCQGDAGPLGVSFPFGRTGDNEKFHAFWTRRLRDKSETGGRPTSEEVTNLCERQADLHR